MAIGRSHSRSAPQRRSAACSTHCLRRPARACACDTLNALMALTPLHWHALRARLTELLSAPRRGALSGAHAGCRRCFCPSRSATTPISTPRSFTPRMSASLFRPDNPLLPNYKHIPIGYHGRASSIVVSGTPIRRPKRTRPRPRTFGPTRALDYELEVGFFIGTGNALGEPIPIESAEDHIFGICLVNDWSARDIQAWEYQPLGPFLGKSFATTHLAVGGADGGAGSLSRTAVLRVRRATPRRCRISIRRRTGREAPSISRWKWRSPAHRCATTRVPPFRLSRGNFKDLYWSIAQMVAHHTSNGCNLRPGDLLASGTVSGPDDGLARLSAGDTRAGRTDHAAHRRGSQVSGRRRRDHSARLLRAAGYLALISASAGAGLSSVALRRTKRPGRRLSVSPKRSNFTPMRSIIER